MNIYDKIRSFCRKFRIMLGVIVLAIGFLLGDGSLNLGWWWLGLLPLIAGLIDFCPTCIISKKCTPKN
jgi:CHASE2 domain-containing sensor protein